MRFALKITSGEGGGCCFSFSYGGGGFGALWRFLGFYKLRLAKFFRFAKNQASSGQCGGF